MHIFCKKLYNTIYFYTSSYCNTNVIIRPPIPIFSPILTHQPKINNRLKDLDRIHMLLGAGKANQPTPTKATPPREIAGLIEGLLTIGFP